MIAFLKYFKKGRGWKLFKHGGGYHEGFWLVVTE